MIEIRRIATDDPVYRTEVALREAVLLGPIGYDLARFEREYPGVEDRFEHYVAVFEHPSGPRAIGCALLLIDEEARTGKLMQMAVDPQRQGEGLGRRLVVAIEARAFGELGLETLYCHAQETAIGFYEKLGWAGEGPRFMEAGIEHLKMVVQAPPEPADGWSQAASLDGSTGYDDLDGPPP
ncbi:MAG: GNAT family N-acetyltransferase [Planctomycetota bacterium]